MVSEARDTGSPLPTGRILLYTINSRMSPPRQAKQTVQNERERETEMMQTE